MALQKAVENEQGVVPNYWKITGYNYIGTNGKCNVTISGYLNKAARDSKKVPITTKNFISDTDLDDKATMYAFLKTVQVLEGNNQVKPFQDAVDC